MIDHKVPHQGKREVLRALNGQWHDVIRQNTESVTVRTAGEPDLKMMRDRDGSAACLRRNVDSQGSWGGGIGFRRCTFARYSVVIVGIDYCDLECFMGAIFRRACCASSEHQSDADCSGDYPYSFAQSGSG